MATAPPPTKCPCCSASLIGKSGPDPIPPPAAHQISFATAGATFETANGTLPTGICEIIRAYADAKDEPWVKDLRLFITADPIQDTQYPNIIHNTVTGGFRAWRNNPTLHLL